MWRMRSGMRTHALTAAAAVVITACGWFEDLRPIEARVVIDGPAGARVQLITSTRFVAGVDEIGTTRVEVFVADTSHAVLPFRQVWVIRSERQFFAQAEHLEDDHVLHMQVFINDQIKFDEAGPLFASAPFRFVYMFNRALTPTIEVVL